MKSQNNHQSKSRVKKIGSALKRYWVFLAVLLTLGVTGFIGRHWIIDEGSIAFANKVYGPTLVRTYNKYFSDIDTYIQNTFTDYNSEPISSQSPCYTSYFHAFRGTVDCGVGVNASFAVSPDVQVKWRQGAEQLERYLIENGWNEKSYGDEYQVPRIAESIDTEYWADTEFTKKNGSIACSIQFELKRDTYRIHTGCSRSVEFFGGFTKGNVWDFR